MEPYLIGALALVAVLALAGWLYSRRATAVRSADSADDRLDTLAGWPPEATRILRNPERLAFSTLKLALPGYMVFAQMPIARFVSVPKRNSYAEWMRRLGGHCVDFVVCDATSRVVAVVDVRQPEAQLNDRLRRRLARVTRVLKAAGIPLHVWIEDRLPSIEVARATILANAPATRPANATATPRGAVAPALAPLAGSAGNPFEDTDRDSTHDEVIEPAEPRASTWFDDLDSGSTPLSAPER